MAEVAGTEKIGEAAASLMDAVDAHLSGCGGAVVNVLIVAELDQHDGDDVYVQALIKATTDSPVYQRGLASAALEVIGCGGFTSGDGA